MLKDPVTYTIVSSSKVEWLEFPRLENAINDKQQRDLQNQRHSQFNNLREDKTYEAGNKNCGDHQTAIALLVNVMIESKTDRFFHFFI